MSNVVANIAVVGRVPLMPGILPVKLENPAVECLVEHAFPPSMESAERGIKIDCADCTVFTVTHRDRGEIDLTLLVNAQRILEQSITAISEVSIWTKSQDTVGVWTSYIRQIGITDVKAFFAQGATDQMIGWINPLFSGPREAHAIVANLLPNMIVSNGPKANPIPVISRRIMASLDLINLGFYTESFVNLFSLVDDLTQEVIKAGLARRGLQKKAQKDFLRAIKEERLRMYLCNLAKLCGWISLEEGDKALFDDVLKVNSIRNSIMHGSRRLDRNEVIEAGNVLLHLIDWLRDNPFGFFIPIFPSLRPATPEFGLIPIIDGLSSDGTGPTVSPVEPPLHA